MGVGGVLQDHPERPAETGGHVVGAADQVVSGAAQENADRVAIGCQPDRVVTAVDQHLHVIENVGVELARQIAKRHLPRRHPIRIAERVDALGEGICGIGAFGGDDPRGRTVDAIGAQMHTIADDQDQGGLADRPVPVGKEGGAAARMRDLRRDALVLATTLVVILVCANMIYQYRAMDGRTAFWLATKIGLIGVFATDWVEFNSLASAVLSGIDSIAGSLVASVGGGTPGPSGTFAEEFDRLIAELGDYLNAAGSELNWMAGALLDVLGVLLLSILGGLAAFILVASRLMIALLIGMAPIMIFLTLFEVTKDYFARWLPALVSFSIYPVVVAGIFATITGVSSALIGELGDPETASNIGALIPFFMMVLMAKGFIIATPFIVRSISGNIMMPTLSVGLGGAYEFGRAAIGSQQAYNRYLIGGASGAEYGREKAAFSMRAAGLMAPPSGGGDYERCRPNGQRIIASYTGGKGQRSGWLAICFASSATNKRGTDLPRLTVLRPRWQLLSDYAFAKRKKRPVQDSAKTRPALPRRS